MVDSISRRPDHVVVAILTNVGRIDMSGILARSLSAIVTTEAIIAYTRVVERRRQPCCGGMAIIAGVAARDMRRVLARGYGAVMAVTTGAQYLGMVDGIRRYPQHVVMAVFAHIGRIDVCGILADSFDAVVAFETAVGDTGMVKPGRCPERRLVTILAVVAGGKVVRRLSCPRNTVVAGPAAAGHGCVIHERDRAPGRCRMAVGAQNGCRHMVQALGRRSHQALR